MEVREFERYVRDISAFSKEEIESFEPISNTELNIIQHNLETEEGDDNSAWDYIKAFITFRKKVTEKEAENKRLREELAKHRKLNPSIGMRADGIFGPRGGGE